MLRKYVAYAVPAHPADGAGAVPVTVWADADDPGDVFQAAREGGWEVLAGRGVRGTDEYEEPAYVYEPVEPA